MLRKLRVTLAAISITLVTLLFLDFSGTAHRWFGWMAKIQFLPALLALNAGVVVALIAVTLIFGRVYCSVICPLGIMQDISARLGRTRRKYRYSYSRALTWLRLTMLAVMAISILLGIGAVVALLAPYSAYGRIAQSLLAPLWAVGNNLLAAMAERADSYAFYSVDVWMRSGITLAVAAATLAVLAVLAWRNGRTYCNTVCPVGTVLGYVARFSWLKPVIDTTRCNACGLCARNCKAACIDSKTHTIDYTRCVTCMNCLDTCRHGAISYARQRATATSSSTTRGKATDAQRRSFIVTSAVVGAAAALRAQEKTVDGGLAVLADKKIPRRHTPIVPAGAHGWRHLSAHCTACQLCVAACPNGVLRPAADPARFMQPEASYERGYCRPECTRCSQVCPTGAIQPVTREEKTAVQVGHAVWVRANCVPLTDGVECGNCARHCPAGAIQMVASDPADEKSVKIPVVNDARCIGCGACENLCPARPFSAIYVEGHERHHNI
ncbi:MAG: 4Fe-4S binding protein [Muribaculaceae bacterium]|nr:4Fe-4S binding protein [Muribaculaceae bacterium]